MSLPRIACPPLGPAPSGPPRADSRGSRHPVRRLAGACALLAILLGGGCTRGPSTDPTPEQPPGGGGVGSATTAPPPEAALSALSVGVRLMEQFQHAEAEAKFLRALALHPRWMPAQVNLAIAQMNQLDPASADRAETSAREALTLMPSDARAHYVMGYVLAERLGRFPDALPHFRAASAAAPADASAHFQFGRTAEETSREEGAGELSRDARAAYEKALELDPKSVEANYRLGRLLLESEAPADLERAESLLGSHERLLAGRPSVQPNYLTRGPLALAYPWERPRAKPALPLPLSLQAGDILPLPPQGTVMSPEAPAAERFRAGLTVADFDGDGRLDLLAPIRDAMRPPIAWWSQSAPRLFETRHAMGRAGGACSTGVAGDLDNDGSMDAFITCSLGNMVLLRKEGEWVNATPRDMSFTETAGMRATLVDFDHDGDLDVHVLLPLVGTKEGWRADSHLWRNDGAAIFGQVAATMGLLGPFASEAFVWTDFDGDNAVDLVALLPSGLTLFRADREGGPHQPYSLPFAPPAAGAGPVALDIETLDADGDDDPDLVILHRGALSVLVNESRPGAPSFRLIELGAPSFTGTALAVADMDLDGVRELVVLAPSEPLGSSRGELLSAGGVDLPVRSVGAEGMDPEVMALADIDGDGGVDVALRRVEGEPQILWNAPAEGATWISLDLKGLAGRSNPQGFGAKLSLDAGSQHERLERRASQGALCSVTAPEIVGLGGRAGLDGVTTLWPSGIQQGEAEMAAGSRRVIEEVDRQPSSCPMLYGWDGSSFQFLTDCFDTAPLGLWVAPGVHWEGDPEEVLRLRPGWVVPIDGVLNLSIAEFLNETLLADRVSLLGIDHEASRGVVVDEGVRLAAPPLPLTAHLVKGERPVRAWQDGRDVSSDLALRDERVAGYVEALPWMGLAEPHALELELEDAAREGLLVLTGSLNFPNSLNLHAAHQANVSASPARLEVLDGRAWRELTPDCGVPAGFHKDVVIDLRAYTLPERPRLRITTNLQVSWDRAVTYDDVIDAAEGALRELPLLRAEKRWLGIPREVKGPQNRWREFPRDGLAGASPWIRQDGPVTPDGDVRKEISAADGALAFVRPGEELLVAFDDAALGVPAEGLVRTHVLLTRGWVKDASPHTANALSVLPLPKALIPESAAAR